MENINCLLCAFKTKSNRNFRYHMKNVHPNNCNRFKCLKCDKVYDRKDNLLRHNKLFHRERVCSICNQKFYSKSDSDNHFKLEHINSSKKNSCNNCKLLFPTKEQYNLHLKHNDCDFINQMGSGKNKILNDSPKLNKSNNFILRKKALKGFVKQYELTPEKTFKDVYELVNFYSKDLDEILSKILSTEHSVKVQICLSVLFYKNLYVNEDSEDKDENSIINNIAYFCPLNTPLTHVENIKSTIDTQIGEINNQIEEFINNGSGWTVDYIVRLDLRIAKYKSRYGCYISIPEKLRNKKTILNIKSKDSKCFLWSIIAHLHPAERDQTNISNYLKYENDFNTNGIKFPINLEMIPKFEKNNNLCINVYSYREEKDGNYEILPIKISKAHEKPICLLLYSDHFFLIKNFNRLLGYDNSTFHHFCFFCLSGFVNSIKLENHIKFCKDVKPQRILLPSVGDNIMKFEQFEKQEVYAFVMYADFECLTVPVEKRITKKTLIYQEHEVCSFAYILIDNDNKIVNHNLYRGKNAARKFLKEIKDIYEKIAIFLENPKTMIFTEEDELNFTSSKKCYLCGKDFGYDIKVRDHSHITGFYRGI